jgi:hypothetical protein
MKRLLLQWKRVSDADDGHLAPVAAALSADENVVHGHLPRPTQIKNAPL